jgi:hypothetical protein
MRQAQLPANEIDGYTADDETRVSTTATTVSHYATKVGSPPQTLPGNCTITPLNQNKSPALERATHRMLVLADHSMRVQPCRATNQR